VRKSYLDRISCVLAGILGGLALIHFVGSEKLDSLFFWLGGLWLPIVLAYWLLHLRSERNDRDVERSGVAK